MDPNEKNKYVHEKRNLFTIGFMNFKDEPQARFI